MQASWHQQICPHWRSPLRTLVSVLGLAAARQWTWGPQPGPALFEVRAPPSILPPEL